MPDLTTTAIALGVVVLIAGFIVAPWATELDQDKSQTGFLDESQAVDLSDRLRLSVTDVNSTQPRNTTISLYDRETRQTVAHDLNQTDNQTYRINNEDINVTTQGITADGTVQWTADYPRTYAWGDEPKRLGNQLPLLLISSGALMIFGGLAAVIRS